MRDSAIALIAAGNATASVAAVFGMSPARLRSLVEQPARSVDVQPLVPESAERWHRFPGTVVYRTGLYVPVLLFVPLLLLIPFLGRTVSHSARDPFVHVVLPGLFLGVLAMVVQLFREARVARFELRPEAIMQFTLRGGTLLPYADIVEIKRAQRRNGIDTVKLLKKNGTMMTLYVRRAQLSDKRLSNWLDSIPPSAPRASADTGCESILQWHNDDPYAPPGFRSRASGELYLSREQIDQLACDGRRGDQFGRASRREKLPPIPGCQLHVSRRPNAI